MTTEATVNLECWFHVLPEVGDVWAARVYNLQCRANEIIFNVDLLSGVLAGMIHRTARVDLGARLATAPASDWADHIFKMGIGRFLGLPMGTIPPDVVFPSPNQKNIVTLLSLTTGGEANWR